MKRIKLNHHENNATTTIPATTITTEAVEAEEEEKKEEEEKEEEDFLPTILHDAIENNMPLHVLQTIVKNHPDQLTRRHPTYGNLPVHAAFGYGNENDLELRFKAILWLVGADPECVREKDRNGLLPLHLAVSGKCSAYSSSIETVRFLVEQYPDGLLEKDNDGLLPIHHYLSHFIVFEICNSEFSMEIFLFLVMQCPESIREKNNDGELPLHIAVESAYPDENENTEYTTQVPRFLIKQFPEGLKVKDKDGYLPLHRAVLNLDASIDLIQEMFERFPLSVCTTTGLVQGMVKRFPPLSLCTETPRHGCLPLHIAVGALFSMDVPRFLVEQFPGGLRVKDNGGYLPLHHAVANENYCPRLDLIQLMVEKFPQSVQEKTLDCGCLPLHLAMNNSCSVEITRFLVRQYPESVQVVDNNGYLPLHHAAANADHSRSASSIEVTRFLVNEFPLSVRVKDNDGYLPLHRAAANRNRCVSVNVVRFLVEQFPVGVHDSTLDRGFLPLHLAVSAGSSIEVVRLLVKEFPLSVRVKDNDGYLPLHRAAKSLKLIKYLVEQYPQGCRETTQSHGCLPLHLAVGANYSTEIPRFLVDKFPESVSVKDNDGYLPLHHAAARFTTSLEMIQFLVEHFPQGLREKTHDHAYLPLHLALSNEYRHLRSIEVIRYLIEQYPQGLKETADDGLLPVFLAATATSDDSAILLHLDLIYFCLLQYPNFLF